MPALPSVPSTLKVDLNYTVGIDITALTRFFISFTGSSPTTAELDTFCAAVNTAWAAQLKANTDESTTLDTTMATDLTSPVSFSGSATSGVAGTLAGTALAGESCFVCTYDILRRYRGGHARGYWRMGTQSDLLNPQQWSSAFTSYTQGVIAAFFAAILAAGWAGAGTLTQSQISYHEGFTVIINPITGRARNVPKVRASALVDTVTGYTGRQRIGSQRRRLGKS